MKRILFVFVVFFLWSCNKWVGDEFMAVAPSRTQEGSRTEGGVFVYQTSDPSYIFHVRVTNVDEEEVADKSVGEYLFRGLPRVVYSDDECEVMQLNHYTYRITVVPMSAIRLVSVGFCSVEELQFPPDGFDLRIE